jgi:hypothetical protein
MIYSMFEGEIVPLFYNHDADGIPMIGFNT